MDRGRAAFGAAEREMRPERPPLQRKAERPELLLHVVLQQLESRLGRDAGPQYARPARVGKRTEIRDRYRDGPARRGSALQRARELLLSLGGQLPHKPQGQA